MPKKKTNPLPVGYKVLVDYEGYWRWVSNDRKSPHFYTESSAMNNAWVDWEQRQLDELNKQLTQTS